MTIDAQKFDLYRSQRTGAQSRQKIRHQKRARSALYRSGTGQGLSQYPTASGNARVPIWTARDYGARNAQDAVGDTMKRGRIIIHGLCGDTVGYAMRGGEIYIKGNTGYAPACI
jgi:hypothetical protein